MSAASQNPRYAELLKRMFSFKSSKAFDVEETVLPTFAVADPTAVEHQFLRDERRWAHRITNAGAAANVNFGRIENPPNSGLLCIVEKVFFRTTAGAGLGIPLALSVQISTGVGSTAGQDCRPLDTRKYNPTFNGIDCRGGVHPAFAGLGLILDSNGAGTSCPSLDAWLINCVLAPGSSLDLENSAVNAAASFNFIYRLRPVDTTEL